MQRYPHGAVLLFIVLVMGSVSLGALAILVRGSTTAFVDANDQRVAWGVRAATFGCLDEVLIQMQKNNDYAPATVTTGDATCTLTVSTPGAGQRRATVVWTSGSVTRSVTADITLSPFAVTQVQEP